MADSSWFNLISSCFHRLLCQIHHGGQERGGEGGGGVKSEGPKSWTVRNVCCCSGGFEHSEVILEIIQFNFQLTNIDSLSCKHLILSEQQILADESDHILIN